MSTYTELTDAQNLIRDRKNWTQGIVKSRDGKRRCALGALDAVSASGPAYTLLADAAMELYGWKKMSEVNDEVGHSAVMACFDLARIRVASAEHDLAEYRIKRIEQRDLIPA